MVLVRTVSRRIALASIAVLTLPFPANSGSPKELNVEADEGGLAMTRYAADRVGKRPAVLVLHGNRDVELSTRATAWPIDPRCSACMAYKSPLSCSADIPRAVRRHPGRAQRRTGFRSGPVSLWRGSIDGRNHHRFEVRERLEVLFVAEWHLRLASAAATRLKV